MIDRPAHLRRIRQLLREHPVVVLLGARQVAELDLLVVRGRHRLGFEFKRTDAPRLPGANTFRLDRRVQALAASEVTEVLKPLR